MPAAATDIAYDAALSIWAIALIVGVLTTLIVGVLALSRRQPLEGSARIAIALFGVGAGAAGWIMGGAQLTYGGSTSLSVPLWAGGLAVSLVSSVALCVVNARYLDDLL